MSNTAIKGFDTERLTQRFFDKFGQTTSSPALYFAPGRVNLIGDHTDYTGGYVFPCGIDTGSLLLIRRTNDKQYRLASTNFDLLAQLSHDQLGKTYGDNWINYPLGVIDQFIQRGVDIDGIDCLFSGNVPNGAGLSSSASIEMVTAFALNELFNCNFTLLELIKMAQAAENDFVGMQCGIMDQFAVAMAEENRAILLNCDSLDYRQIPLTLGDNAIVLANTNQRRELNESAFNERVAECARALNICQNKMDISALGQVKPAELEAIKGEFSNDAIAFKRATHVSNENRRVLQAVVALEKGDLQAFGELMNQSHDSLRECFNVSSEPLDHLVSSARAHPGVLGSRLTGAGFGGCTVNILPERNINAFINDVSEKYQKNTGLSADFYVIQPGSGVRKLHA